MRVNHSVTYDISKGAPVKFVGMTRNGSKVVFSTFAQLTADDTDNSSDIYVWSEGGSEPDSLVRITKGNGHGNTDECNASWVSDCDADSILPEKWRGNRNTALSGPGMDDIVSENSGDVYFWSPEVLDPTRLGLKDERNLYLYRNGKVQLVSHFDPGTSIQRLQISPDGKHAAILTKSRMTSYDNNGYAEVYVYDADSRVIKCASCVPTGERPQYDVAASEGGRFMSDDGRAFFATKDDLVPRDQDGNRVDVYEYVGGRPS